uniref:Uncharacterized protein n=1 Tax=Steinernema glaseri TaxID=37863 RepID=A0A1I7YTB0_9BILA
MCFSERPRCKRVPIPDGNAFLVEARVPKSEQLCGNGAVDGACRPTKGQKEEEGASFRPGALQSLLEELICCKPAPNSIKLREH